MTFKVLKVNHVNAYNQSSGTTNGGIMFDKLLINTVRSAWGRCGGVRGAVWGSVGQCGRAELMVC